MRGIYKITCIINKKTYIGESLNIKKRWEVHKEDLNNRTHHSKDLQYDWIRYGEQNFDFEIIALLDDDIKSLIDKYILIIFEYRFMLKYNSLNIGYNTENTLKLVMENKKKLYENISVNKKTCERYLNMCKDKKLICKHGKICYSYNTFKDIQKNLKKGKKDVFKYLVNSSYYSGNEKYIINNEYKDKIVENSTYDNTKISHELYKEILEEFEKLILKNIQIDPLKHLKTIDCHKLDSELLQADSCLISRLALKYGINKTSSVIYKLLRDYDVMEFVKYDDKRCNYPTKLNRDKFYVLKNEEYGGISVYVKKEYEDFIISIIK